MGDRLADACRLASPVQSRGAVALLLVLSLLPGPTRAQLPEHGWGTITGTVYDSLLHSPLARATVSILNSSRSTETDDRGRFVLDSVPAGTQMVSFWRSDLDSIGLSSFVAKVTVEAGRSVSVELVVPSHATFWRAACGGGLSGGSSDSGLVFGTVADAETGFRIGGAQVSVSWVAVERRGETQWAVLHPSRTVTTDSVGSYYVCGTPVEYVLATRAYAGGFRSGLIDVLVDPRGITRRDLEVSLDSVSGAADSGAGRGGRATLVGSVRGERGGLLPGAYASIDDVDAKAEADSLGRFVLRDLPSGTHMLMVRRIGYFAARQPVNLRNRDTTRVDMALAEALVLDTLRVTASADLAPIIEEIDRRRLAGFGYFLSPGEIRARGSVRSLFEGFPLVEVSGYANRFSVVIRKTLSIRGGDSTASGAAARLAPGRQGGGQPRPSLQGGMPGTFCTPDIFIDGHPADAEQLASLNVQNLFAVEVYTHPNAGLMQYLYWHSECGVILVWTRAAR